MNLNNLLQKLLIGGAAACAFSASAWTVDDLVSYGGAIEYRYSPYLVSHPNSQFLAYTNAVKLTPVDEEIKNNYGDKVYKGFLVENLFDSGYNFFFYISDSQGNPVEDGYYVSYCAEEDDVLDYYLRPGQWTITQAKNGNYGLMPCYLSGAGNGYGYTNPSSTYHPIPCRYNWTGEINYTSDGLSIDFPDPVCFTTFTAKNGFGSYSIPNVVDHYSIQLFRPNATITTKVTPYDKTVTTNPWTGVSSVSWGWGTTETISYPAKVSVANGVVSIVNFDNQGYALNRNENAPTDMMPFRFSYNASAQEAYYEGGNYGYIYYNWKNSSASSAYIQNTIQFPVMGYDKASGTATDAIKATFTEGDGGPRHNSGTNGWVTNGGPRRTYEGGVLTLGGHTFYRNHMVSGVPEHFDYYHDTEIPIDADITLDVALNLGDTFGTYYDGELKETALYVDGTLNVAANDKYVKEYQLWMVPGHHSSVSGNSDFIHPDGHTKGFCVDEFDGDIYDKNARRSASLTHGVRFAKRIPLSQIPEASRNDDNKYTFYIKAIYEPASGLTPTFHSLQTTPTPTSVEGPAAGYDRFGVSVSEGTLHITGSDARAEVFSSTGATVYSGFSREIALPGGIYIVRIGSEAVKVAVP